MNEAAPPAVLRAGTPERTAAVRPVRRRAAPLARARAFLSLLAELTKLRISAMSTLTTATGYLLFARRITLDLAVALGGTLLVAAAASALNQLQEARLDAMMPRTAGRPLPSGRIDPGAALLVVVVLAGLGLATLASLSTRPVAAAGLAALAMAWYNGVYTPLKRVTVFAVVPGAVIGAIPPLIGWVAAGGRLSDGAIWFVASFFFLWQVPHFWLLTLMYGAQYAKAGLRTLAERFASGEIARLTFAWQLAAACAAPLAAIGARAGGAATVMAAALSLWLVVSGRALLRARAAAADYRRAFMRINFYALAITATLAAAPWLR